MRRVEAGALGDRPEIRRPAAERAASLEFDLGLVCLRTGRGAEGRQRMHRASQRGPARRRALATLGSWAPNWALAKLMRWSWLKGTVSGSRQPTARIMVGSESRGAA